MAHRRDGKTPRPKKRKAAKYIGALAFIFGAAGCGAYFTPRFLISHPHVHAAVPHIHFQPQPAPDRQTILLIGTDARMGDPLGNADVLCVASIDDKHRRVELLSIPRDTQVAFPDGRYHKINDALAISGPELTLQVVENLIGLPIDHYAVTRFDGLVHIIDQIGGIHIDVPERMHYVTGDKTHGVIRLEPGEQRLNGEQALGFVRFRHDALGDIGRTRRQQSFLVALKAQLLRPQTIPKLPGIVMDAVNSMQTDMTLVDLGKLATHAKQYASYQSIHETLPGSFHNPVAGRTDDLSYWVINPKQARYAAKQFFEDGIVQVNPIQDPAQTHSWQYPTAMNEPQNASTAG